MRCASGREGKSYQQIPIIIYGDEKHRAQNIHLADMLDRYVAEASLEMKAIFTQFERLILRLDATQKT